MIEIKDLMKSFGHVRAVNRISMTIREQQVFGLVGTNGAGKSTLLRMICGVLKPDQGEVLVDGAAVYDNPDTKLKLFFIADDPYYFRNATPEDMEDYFRGLYPCFDTDRFRKLSGDLGLERNRRIADFSKGMKKQLSVILGLCMNTRYLICDETFDGLDPVMRQTVKSLFAQDMVERGLTPIIASHNLRELEDICDHVGLLHQGGVLFSSDLDDMKLGLTKLQAVFSSEEEREKALQGLKVMTAHRTGRMETLTIRGEREEIRKRMEEVRTEYFELLPLTLEEIFISETEVAGYDIKKLILN